MDQREENTNRILVWMVRKYLFEDSFAGPLNCMDIDWDELYQELEFQGITACLARVLDDDALCVPKEIRVKWLRRTGMVIRNTHLILTCQEQAVLALQKSHITVAVLKGAVAAINYPMPEWRAMGDVDLLVSEEEFSRARECLLTQGYRLVDAYENVPDAKLREKHICMQKDGVYLELHNSPFRIEDPALDMCLNEFMMNSMTRIEWQSFLNYKTPSLPMPQNAIEFLVHVQGHLCGTGVGLRQVLDWAFFASRYLEDDIYEQELRPILQHIGLEYFAKVLTRMCQLYLGLSEERMRWCIGVDEGVCLTLLEYILKKGNFGIKDSTDYVARAVVKMSHPIRFLKNMQQSSLKRWPELKQRKITRTFAGLILCCRHFKYILPWNTNLKDEMREGKKRGVLFEQLRLFETSR